MSCAQAKLLLDCGQSGWWLLAIPERVAQQPRRWQKAFDRWLMDRTNPHGYWQRDPDGAWALCYDPPTTFTRWLNEAVLEPGERAAVLGEQSAEAARKAGLPVLHF